MQHPRQSCHNNPRSTGRFQRLRNLMSSVVFEIASIVHHSMQRERSRRWRPIRSSTFRLVQPRRSRPAPSRLPLDGSQSESKYQGCHIFRRKARNICSGMPSLLLQSMTQLHRSAWNSLHGRPLLNVTNVLIVFALQNGWGGGGGLKREESGKINELWWKTSCLLWRWGWSPWSSWLSELSSLAKWPLCLFVM